MAEPLLRAQNTLDCTLLEPGDILVVANPTDIGLMRLLLFWSHVGIVSTDTSLVIDAVREPRGEWSGEPRWRQVQAGPLASYLLSYDVLAVRPKLPAAARRAAALYAESKVGTPYAASVARILLGRRDTSAYSCASLMWQAYQRQGLDLAPVPAWCSLTVVPLFLARDPRIEVIGRGTRYRLLGPSQRRLTLERLWYRRVLGADILVSGCDD